MSCTSWDVAGVDDRVTPSRGFEEINKELRLYDPRLAEGDARWWRPTRSICRRGGRTWREVPGRAVEAEGYKVFPISAAANAGVWQLMQYIAL